MLKLPLYYILLALKAEILKSTGVVLWTCLTFLRTEPASMPRKVLPDENANAKRKSDVASKRNGMARKRVLLGGGHDPTEGRIFAREIKNIAGSTSCQNAKATVNELECGISGELSLLDRFTTDFGVLYVSKENDLVSCD